jgi:hypothetical protein
MQPLVHSRPVDDNMMIHHHACTSIQARTSAQRAAALMQPKAHWDIDACDGRGNSSTCLHHRYTGKGPDPERERESGMAPPSTCSVSPTLRSTVQYSTVQTTTRASCQPKKLKGAVRSGPGLGTNLQTSLHCTHATNLLLLFRLFTRRDASSS